MAMNFDWISAAVGAVACYLVAPKLAAAQDAIEGMKNAPTEFAKAMAQQGREIAAEQKAAAERAEKEKQYDAWLAANPNASAAAIETFRRSIGL